jgi:hypothetical protein
LRIRRGFVGLATAAASAVVAVPLLVTGSASAGAASPGGQRPQVVDATHTSGYIFGEPEIAVNPTNPNNIVYVATKLAETPDCQTNLSNPNHAQCVSISTVFGPQPAGLIGDDPGFSPNGISVSFDGGARWRSVTVPTLPPPFPDTGRLMGGDPVIAVGPHGTFYFAEDVVDFQTGFPPETASVARDAGIAVSKSTDGGLKWSTPVLAGTDADRPFFTVDPNTGMIYGESGSGALGAASTTNPSAPATGAPGRYVVESKDGVHWSTPQYVGKGINGPYISAAHGVFATGGFETDTTFCGGASGCMVLQTTTNGGKTWSDYPIPNSSNASTSGLLGASGPLIAADPTKAGHFTAAWLNSTTTFLYVTQTRDGGRTWSLPTVVTQDSSKTQWKPWIDYGPDGTLGLMWRTWSGAVATSPYSVWTAISKNGGKTFTKPLEVSHGDSPPPFAGTPLFPTFADDFSFITLDHQDAFVGWGDMRLGPVMGRQGFLSKIPLQAFTHA